MMSNISPPVPISALIACIGNSPNLRSVLSAIFIGLPLASCVGDPTESSSSVASVNSSVPAVSSIANISSVAASSMAPPPSCNADAQRGKAIYTGAGLNCVTCHGEVNGTNKTPGRGTNPPIAIFESPYGITAGKVHTALDVYIEKEMVTYYPPGSCSGSDLQCAEDIAAYLYESAGRNWCAEKDTASSVSSIPAQSSSSQANSSMPKLEEERAVSVITINAGGNDVVNSNGVAFKADEGFTGGNVSDRSNSMIEVANTEDDVLFLSERWNPFTYSFALPNGTYSVELGFMELVDTHTAGSRVFNVAIEGEVKLSNIDVVSAVGSTYTALVKEVKDIVVTDGSLDLDFRKVTHNPTVSYINIKRLETPKDKYVRMCASCHGDSSGEGRSEIGDALVKSRCTQGVCATRQSLSAYIGATMPFGLPEACTGQCAQDIADYIFDNFAGYGNNASVNLSDYLDKGGDNAACNSADSGVSPLRRLAKLDYNHMTRDLFGLTDDFTKGFIGDELLGSFSINTGGLVAPGQVRQYFDVAAEVAEKAVANKQKWIPCNAQTNACAEQVIDDIARKAFRRPLSNPEQTRLMAIFTQARNADNFDQGIKVLLRGILTAPQFLYYIEQGQGSGKVKALTQYELAGRMGLFLWRSLPDKVLLDLAGKGQLQTDAQIRAQVERMLSDPRARAVVRIFHSQWMQISLPKQGTQDYDAQLAAVEGFNRMVESVVLGEDLDGDGKQDNTSEITFGSLADLFAVDYTYLNDKSKNLYELSGDAIASGHGGFDKYKLNSNRRKGALTRVAFLRSNHSTTERGLYIRQEVLCDVIPEPPATAVDQPREAMSGLNPRELFKLHTEDPGCAGCHVLMDPLGYPLDHFDGEGHWQDEYGEGFAVDASGEMVLTDVNGSFEGADGLQGKLGESRDVKECYTYQWFKFATGRFPTKEDGCSLGQINEQAYSNQGSGSIKDVMVNVVLSHSFRNLRTAP